MTVSDYIARAARKAGRPLSVAEQRAIVAELKSEGVTSQGVVSA